MDFVLATTWSHPRSRLSQAGHDIAAEEGTEKS